MKKRWTLLIFPLLVALMLPAASASELLGNVLSLVLNSPDDAVLADDCRADAEDARIIIASGAHYQLIAAAKQENGWESAVVSTNAVYQPSEGHGVPTLTRTEDGFELAYPEAGEVYRFALRHDSTNQPMYTLVYAKMGDMEVTKRENFGYLVTQGEDGAVWSKMVTLADFNIHQMPRGTADVQRMNEMACGLQRFANVRKDGVKEIRQEWRHVPIQTVCGTYLTDDPHVSEAHQEELPAGTKLTALGYCGWAYVYVEATVDGKITRGFVPQRDVVFDDVELPDEEAKLVGSWQMEAGGEQPYHGTWSVVQTPADSNLYWRGDIPTIVFRCVNGTVYRYGVGVSESADYEVTEGDYCRSMSLITCEGGTGYVSYGVYGEGGGIITDENGKLILKELNVTNELNWGEYWEEEGNG